MCKAEFLLLGPRCSVGAAKPMSNARNPHLALQGPFGTAEGRETMTTTPETSLEVNAGSIRACTACAKPSFHSFVRNALSVRSNQGKTHAMHTWLSRAIWYCPEGRKNMTSTPETSLEVNYGPYHARIVYAKPSLHSLARNAPSVQSNRGKTHAIGG